MCWVKSSLTCSSDELEIKVIDEAKIKIVIFYVYILDLLLAK